MTPEAKKLEDKLKLCNVEMQTKTISCRRGVLTYNIFGTGFVVVPLNTDQESLQYFKTLDDVLKTWKISP
jgi:hypothetical protein